LDFADTSNAWFEACATASSAGHYDCECAVESCIEEDFNCWLFSSEEIEIIQ
jgi:hypothetical protein